jgi:hypothetical protein
LNHAGKVIMHHRTLGLENRKPASNFADVLEEHTIAQFGVTGDIEIPRLSGA